MEDAKYVFEAKTIQRMELLVLSTLNWKMNPVTPLSFFDHIVRRLGLKTHSHWEFLGRCEHLLLSIIAGEEQRMVPCWLLGIFAFVWITFDIDIPIGCFFFSDSRFVCYLPSILATATMMHVIKEVEPCNHLEYQNQLMEVLKISEVCVDDSLSAYNSFLLRWGNDWFDCI